MNKLYYKEYSTSKGAIRQRKYREKNPKYRFDMNREYQIKWRSKNIELNRYRARTGMLAKKMYDDIILLMKGKAC